MKARKNGENACPRPVQGTVQTEPQEVHSQESPASSHSNTKERLTLNVRLLITLINIGVLVRLVHGRKAWTGETVSMSRNAGSFVQAKLLRARPKENLVSFRLNIEERNIITAQLKIIGKGNSGVVQPQNMMRRTNNGDSVNIHADSTTMITEQQYALIAIVPESFVNCLFIFIMRLVARSMLCYKYTVEPLKNGPSATTTPHATTTAYFIDKYVVKTCISTSDSDLFNSTVIPAVYHKYL